MVDAAHLLWYTSCVESGKRIEVRFYRSPSGAEPVRDWLLSLSREDRLVIGTDIKAVEIRIADDSKEIITRLAKIESGQALCEDRWRRQREA